MAIEMLNRAFGWNRRVDSHTNRDVEHQLKSIERTVNSTSIETSDQLNELAGKIDQLSSEVADIQDQKHFRQRDLIVQIVLAVAPIQLVTTVLIFDIQRRGRILLPSSLEEWLAVTQIVILMVGGAILFWKTTDRSGHFRKRAVAYRKMTAALVLPILIIFSLSLYGGSYSKLLVAVVVLFLTGFFAWSSLKSSRDLINQVREGVSIDQVAYSDLEKRWADFGFFSTSATYMWLFLVTNMI